MRWTLIVALTMAATLGARASAPASAKALTNTSCPPISGAQLHSILKLPKSLQSRNTVDDDGPGIDHLCNGVAWSGSAPTSFQASLQRAKRGHAAAFGIESWRQNEGSAAAGQWPKEWDSLTDELALDTFKAPGLFTNIGWRTKHVTPVSLGYQRSGDVVTVGNGPAKGLVAAVGCWWSEAHLTAACLFVEEAPSKSVLKHLNAMAKIAIPKVL